MKSIAARADTCRVRSSLTTNLVTFLGNHVVPEVRPILMSVWHALSFIPENWQYFLT
ncbi:protein of unknown function [Serratia sp. Tan611]|nr:protein of unknown function [Serratia sp. Tan611]